MQQWIKDGVAEVARELARAKGDVSPFEVYLAVGRYRPDIIRHLKRYGSGDPYQYVKIYIPKDVYKK